MNRHFWMSVGGTALLCGLSAYIVRSSMREAQAAYASRETASDQRDQIIKDLYTLIDRPTPLTEQNHKVGKNPVEPDGIRTPAEWKRFLTSIGYTEGINENDGIALAPDNKSENIAIFITTGTFVKKETLSPTDARKYLETYKSKIPK